MAPTNRGVAKQIQGQRPATATPVFNHDGTNIVISGQQHQSPSTAARQPFASLNIPYPNLPPGISRNDAHIESPFTQFAQSQQPFNGMNMGMSPMAFNHHPQFNSSDPLSASSSVPTPTPTPTPGPASLNGFQQSYYGFNANNNGNNNMRSMAQNSNPNTFYSNGAGAHSGSLGPMFGNGMQSPEPFGQGQYGMPMNYNMGFGFPGQQQHHHQSQQANSQPQSFNMPLNNNNNNMYNMPFSPTGSVDFNSNYEPPSTSSSDTPDRDNGDGMDMEFEVDSVEMLPGGSYALLSPSTEMLTSPSSDRMSGGGGTESSSGPGTDPAVKGEDFGSNSTTLSPPLLGEAKSISGTPTISNATKTTNGPVGTGSSGKPSLPSSKEKEQNKQKLYRNRKSEFTNKMRDELLGMGMLPSTRVTHAPEIMSKTADTLKDYRELLELIQNKIEGMPTNIAAVPGAVKKLLNENSNIFNNLRQPPQLSLAQQTQQTQQQQSNHGFKPDIKVPLGSNMTGTTNSPLTGRVTRSGAHVF